MLKGKRIACVLSTSLLLSTYGTHQTPFRALATEVVKNNDFEMVQMQDYRLKKLQEQYQKDKAESDRIKAEEKAKRQKQLEEQKKVEPQWQEFIVSFYTGLDEENYDGCGGRNCLNQPLERGMIANNTLPMGTKIFLDNDYGIRIVADKGSSRFDSENRIDLYVAKWDNETREQWKHRAESYGVRTIRGYIVK